MEGNLLKVSEIMANLLPTIRPTFPDRQMLQSQVFTGKHLAVIETSLITFEECACEQFHFLIPLRQAPVIRTENKLHALEKMSVFPCNPMQPHQIHDTGIVDFKALIIYMEKTFLQTVAEDLFGNRNIELSSSCFAYSPELKELISKFIHECRSKQLGCSLMLESLSVQIAVLLLRLCHQNPPVESCLSGKHWDNKSITQAIEYLTDNYQKKISLSDLASETHYSPYHFLRLFKQHTGKTPFEYLLDLKIEKAKTLLKKTDYSIAETSYLSGFSSTSYFSQTFKKKTGLSPSQYRLNR